MTRWRVAKRFLRALLYAYLARWGQKHGVNLPLDAASGIGLDPDTLAQAVNAGVLLGADKGIREKWDAIRAWFRGKKR